MTYPTPRGEPASEGDAVEAERVAAFSMSRLGLEGPDLVSCQPLRYQIATKLHAVTERFEGRTNDRYRDLIDLILLAELQPDTAWVARACREVFAERSTHSWPPALAVEPGWPQQYQALAVEQGFPITDVEEAAGVVRELIGVLADADP